MLDKKSLLDFLVCYITIQLLVNYVLTSTSCTEMFRKCTFIITQLHYTLKCLNYKINSVSIYTLSDLGVLSNLVGSLSLANEH